MGQIFRVIFSLSISGGMVGLLIMLFRPVTRRFFSKKWAYYLWLLVLVRLLVPIHADINLMGRLSVMLTETADQKDRGSAASGSGVANEAMIVRTPNTEISAAATSASDMSDKMTVGAPAEGREADQAAVFFQIAGIIWILGVFLTVVYRVCTYRNFAGRIRAGCMPVTNERVLRKSSEIAFILGMTKKLPLYENEAVNTPMLIGIRKPYIVLPSKLLMEMAGRENDICLILHHELIHYKRKDIWYKWLFQMVLCVHWFNPLVYLFSRKFHIDCELACDEAVMKLLSEEGRRMYGSVLLDVAENSLTGEDFRMHRNVPMMTLLEEKSTLKERLQGIVKYQKKGFLIGFCSAIVLIMLVAAAVVCGVAGVRSYSDRVFVMRNNSSGIVGQVMKSIRGISEETSLQWPVEVNEYGKSYRMYDNDTMIAGESGADVWQARNYYGGENRRIVDRFVLNGSDVLWIVYANQETTLEMKSAFTLRDGRFKIVQVKPDQTVQVLNEDGAEVSETVTLPEGRNCFKMVGQNARIENIKISYSGENKKDIAGIYYSEDEEYVYRVQAGLEPLDLAKLRSASVYLQAEQVSELYRCAWESDMVLSGGDWKSLFLYSDETLTSQYLLEALQNGKITEFDSHILSSIAYLMNGTTVSECFRCLLDRGKVSELDLENIFVYSDEELSAEYLIEALKAGKAGGIAGEILANLSYRLSSDDLTDVVLALGKDDLTYENLFNYVLPLLEDEQNIQCIFHYIDLGNVLTDEQLRKVQGYVSGDDIYRIIEYNGKNK